MCTSGEGAHLVCPVVLLVSSHDEDVIRMVELQEEHREDDLEDTNHLLNSDFQRRSHRKDSVRMILRERFRVYGILYTSSECLPLSTRSPRKRYRDFGGQPRTLKYLTSIPFSSLTLCLYRKPLIEIVPHDLSTQRDGKVENDKPE